MQLPPILQGDSLTRLLQGAAGGCAITLIVGFGWGGWQLASKAQKTAEESATNAVVAALAPICVDRFQHAADAKTSLVALKATDSWKQDTYVEKGGWATISGSEPNASVAQACATLLGNLK